MFNGVTLNLPTYPFRLREEQGKWYIFDELRKKMLVLTPEEWVRQHWIHFLWEDKGYPKGLMKTEGGLVLNTLHKRSDLLISDSSGNAILLAEFKAPHIPLTQVVFDQIARYNMIHKVPLLLLSNGLQHRYCRIDFKKASFEFLSELPAYDRG
ncbi:Type I restriction enzyme R protein N terminus (HSDR_N) [bacterium A37T11]|nr:Type I restriction enzyme R protein N terminus (HSDR_N) [bacterium A37T11]